MALGIFVGIPAVIGFAIAGVYFALGHRPLRTERYAEAPGKVMVKTA